MSYPILYSENEIAFAGNGLGVLSDAIACTVTEELNGAYTLELRYPARGLHSEELEPGCLLLARPGPDAAPQPFRVREITTPLRGAVTVYAEHISYDLEGYTVGPFTAATVNEALRDLDTHADVKTPFAFWTDKTTEATMTVATPASIRSLMGGSQGSVLDVYGGEYEFDRFTVRLHTHRGADRGFSIRYGKNLLDLTQERNIRNTWTGVRPWWADADGNLVELPEKILAAPGSFAFTRIKPLDLSQEWQSAPTVEQLRARAERYIRDNSIGVPKVSLTVKFAQLSQSEEYRHLALLERVALGDTVHVAFPALGVDATAKVIATAFNVLLDRYDSIELGDARTTLVDVIAEQQRAIEQAPTTTAMQQAIRRQTELITGNRGGYVVTHDADGDGYPDEQLIMDAPSIEAARRLWRWNIAGLGYSNNGYDGPYVLGMTMDGAFNASMITTGTLDASKISVTNLDAGCITAGILKSRDGSTWINMETGEGNFAGNVYAKNISAGGDAGYITGSQVGSGTLTGGNVASHTLGGGNIAQATVSGWNIGGSTITGSNIGGDTVTRSNLQEKYATSADFNRLSADVANINTILGGFASVSFLGVTKLQCTSMLYGPNANTIYLRYSDVLKGYYLGT